MLMELYLVDFCADLWYSLSREQGRQMSPFFISPRP